MLTICASMNASSVTEDVARLTAQRAIKATATTARMTIRAIDQYRFDFFPGTAAGGADALGGGAAAAPAVAEGVAEFVGFVVGGPPMRASCHATTRPTGSSTIGGCCRATPASLIKPAGSAQLPKTRQLSKSRHLSRVRDNGRSR